MTKKIVEAAVEEIKKHLKDSKLVIGSEQTMKLLKLGRIQKVFLANNVSALMKSDVEHYSKLSGAVVEQLDHPNEELGVLCTKPFPITILGIRKD